MRNCGSSADIPNEDGNLATAEVIVNLSKSDVLSVWPMRFRGKIDWAINTFLLWRRNKNNQIQNLGTKKRNIVRL